MRDIQKTEDLPQFCTKLGHQKAQKHKNNSDQSCVDNSVGPVVQLFICAFAFCGLVSWFDVVLEKLDDVFSGGARQKNFGDALFL